jgi:hypothetical protein
LLDMTIRVVAAIGCGNERDLVRKMPGLRRLSETGEASDWLDVAAGGRLPENMKGVRMAEVGRRRRAAKDVKDVRVARG